MSRIIKFRGYSQRLNKWLYGDLLHYQNQLAIIPFDSDWLNVIGELKLLNIDYVVEKESVGQFTGSLDKTKQEIFENDFVEYKVGKNYIKGLVELNEQSRWVKGSNQDLCTYKATTKIIGNVFDNPNLLKP